MVLLMTQTPFLTRSQRAIARMIKNAGYELTNYSQDDRLAARNKLLAIVPTAPDYAPSNKPAKRTKAFFVTLADSMEDNVWRYL
jgi:hypothetical protein